MSVIEQVCTSCHGAKGAPYYAKGLCAPCYQVGARLKHAEARRAYDRARQQTEARRQQDRDRHVRSKPKRNARSRAYRAEHLERLKAYDKQRWATDPKRRQALAEYRQGNLEHVRAADRREYQRNKSKHIARVMERRAHKGQATPKWLTAEQRQQIHDLYLNRPDGHHVDHIIPLQGKDVCGLHVPWNLQYLLATQNLRKGNRCPS